MLQAVSVIFKNDIYKLGMLLHNHSKVFEIVPFVKLSLQSQHNLCKTCNSLASMIFRNSVCL